MPSDREIEVAAKALFPFLSRRYRWDDLPKDCPAHMDARHKAKTALSAAATARPDWEGIALKALGRIAAGPNDAPYSEPWSMAEAKIALAAFERASLGEGEGGR